jgi:hypothetical protein
MDGKREFGDLRLGDLVIWDLGFGIWRSGDLGIGDLRIWDLGIWP